MAKTYYQELGLDPNATTAEIKRKYLELAKQYHPDAATGSDAAFVKLQTAYDVLSDTTKRADYDKTLTTPKTPPVKPKATPAPVPIPPKTRFHLTWFRGVVGVMVILIVALFVRVAITWSGGIGGPTVTPNASVTPTASPTPTPTVSPSDSSTPTDTPAPTDTPVPSPTDSPTPTMTGEGIAPTVTPSPFWASGSDCRRLRR